MPGRALVVDDAPLARAVLSDALSAFGMQVDEAVSGQEAVERYRTALAATHPYDVVLLDWRMPGLDGVETLDLMRRHFPAGRSPDVMMVSAADAVELDAAVRPREVSAVLSKPVTRSRLHDVLARRLRPVLSPEPERHFAGVRALVVDDDETNRIVAEGMLARLQVEPTVVDGGVAALERLAQEAFDLVFLDIRMPEMDGFECLSLIRERHGGDLAVVMLSADVQPSATARARTLGASDFLAKPIDPAALVECLSRWTVGGSAASSSARRRSAFFLAPIAGIDMASASRRAGGDMRAWFGWISLFVERYRGQVDVIAADYAAGKLAQVEHDLHTLKGSAANLGAVALAESAAALEAAHAAGERLDFEVARALLAEIVDAVDAAQRNSPAEPSAPSVRWSAVLDQLEAAIADALLVDDEVVDAVRQQGPDQVGQAAAAEMLAALDDFDFDAAAKTLAQWRG